MNNIYLTPNWSSPAFVTSEISGSFSFVSITGPIFQFTSNNSINPFTPGDTLIIYQGGTGSFSTGKVSGIVGTTPPYTVSVTIWDGAATTAPIDSIRLSQYSAGDYMLDGAIEWLLNFSIFDIKEMKRTSTFSKTIDIPFTQNNNKIFTQLYNVNTTGGFNPKQKSGCVVTDGGILVTSGYLQLISIDTYQKLYKCIYYGETANFVDDISDYLILGNDDFTKDLNFNELIHNKYKDVVVDSWNNLKQYVYGPIQSDTQQHTKGELEGDNGVGLNWRFLNLKMRVKYIFYKIFAKWGYTIDSTFLTSDLFNSVVTLASTDKPFGEPVIKYNTTTSVILGTPQFGLDWTYTSLPLATQVVDPFGSHYNTTTHRFTLPYRDRFSVSVGVNFNSIVFAGYASSLSGLGLGRMQIFYKIYRKGVQIAFQPVGPQVWETGKLVSGSGWIIDPIKRLELASTEIIFDFQENDQIEFFIGYNNLSVLGQGTIYSTKGTGTFTIFTDTLDFISINTDRYSTNPISSFTGVKQYDIIADVVKMFNLYIMPDKLNPRKLIMEPRDEFYRGGNVVSNLVYDRETVNISYLNEQCAKEYKFTYTGDEDFGNKSYTEAYNGRVYGDAIVNLDNDFLTNTKEVKVSSSPTFFTPVSGNIVMPNITGTETFNKRYYFYNGLQNYLTTDGTFSSVRSLKYSIPANATQSTNASIFTQSTFPSFSNYSIYNSEAGQSVLFASANTAKKENSLYYTYYENEIETYADPSSHILTIDVFLNTQILNSFTFRDRFYFEVNGNPHYYTLISITNYDPQTPGMYEMKFLSYFDFRSKKPKRKKFAATQSIPKGNIGGWDSALPLLDKLPNPETLKIGRGSSIGGEVSGVLSVGEGNVLAGDNINVIINGNNILLEEGVSNILANTSDALFTASNIAAFGKDGNKTYSVADTFNFDTFIPVISNANTATIPTPVAGMQVFDVDNIMKYYNGTSWTYSVASSGSTASVARVLHDHYTDAGNFSTTLTDVYLDIIAANTLANNGDKIECEYGGVYVSSATATRQIQLSFAGTSIFNTGNLTLSLSSAWSMYALIIRVSSTVIRYNVSFATEGAALSAYTSVGELTGLTLSNSNNLKLILYSDGVGAASNDIVAKLGCVKFTPKA